MSTPSSVTAPSEHPGMGAALVADGVTFRVWAPNAVGVAVTGGFIDWDDARKVTMARDGDGGSGTWSAHVPGVTPGTEYQFLVTTGEGTSWRVDPYARQMTNSVGNPVVYDTQAFDWRGDDFHMPPWDEVVIYEMHIGTFGAGDHGRGNFANAIERLDHLVELDVSAVQIMPPFEYAGDISWGYNPAHIMAIESSYGGPDELKRFVKEAHARGIAVIVDVVHNHIGPSDIDLWRFDGWYENEGGGIYFYNDHRAQTPWGATRPDYGRPEVRGFLRDSAALWLEEFHCDGLRFDATNYIRSITGGTWDASSLIPDATAYLAWLTDELRGRMPWKLLIAEDNQQDPFVTTETNQGGLGFHTQWDSGFVHPVRKALTELRDEDRDMYAVAKAALGVDRGAAPTRVIYTESHDEVANGKTRLPEAVSPGDAESWAAKKRAVLGSVLVMCSPGVPMFFQGQEFLEDEWFNDSVALDWNKAERHPGIIALHRDLVRMRRNRDNVTRGLRGRNGSALRIDNDAKVIVMHRWADGGPHDDTVVVLNLSAREVSDYRIGLPRPGRWSVRLNTDSPLYAPDFGGTEAYGFETSAEAMDGCGQSGRVTIGPYSAVVLSLEP